MPNRTLQPWAMNYVFGINFCQPGLQNFSLSAIPYLEGGRPPCYDTICTVEITWYRSISAHCTATNPNQPAGRSNLEEQLKATAARWHNGSIADGDD
jgi:hypothetical protein